MNKYIKIILIFFAATSTSYAATSSFNGDFDGDGNQDHATIKKDFNNKSVVDIRYGGNGNRYLRYPLQGYHWTNQKWLAGDFNGDGKTDLLAIYNKGGKPRVWQHTSTGSWFTGKFSTLKGSYFKGQSWFLHDYNYDGKADIQLKYPKNGKTRRMVFLAKNNGFEQKPSVSLLE